MINRISNAIFCNLFFHIKSLFDVYFTWRAHLKFRPAISSLRLPHVTSGSVLDSAVLSFPLRVSGWCALHSFSEGRTGSKKEDPCPLCRAFRCSQFLPICLKHKALQIPSASLPGSIRPSPAPGTTGVIWVDGMGQNYYFPDTLLPHSCSRTRPRTFSLAWLNLTSASAFSQRQKILSLLAPSQNPS